MLLFTLSWIESHMSAATMLSKLVEFRLFRDHYYHRRI